MATDPQARSATDHPKLGEAGAPGDGAPQEFDRRLYCQLHVFGNCANTESLKETFSESGREGVLDYDLHDPLGVGVVVITEDRDVLVGEGR